MIVQQYSGTEAINITFLPCATASERNATLRLFADALSFVSGKADHIECIYETTYFIPR